MRIAHKVFPTVPVLLLLVVFIPNSKRLQRAVIFILVHSHLRVCKTSVVGIYLILKLIGQFVGNVVSYVSGATVTSHCQEPLRIVVRN